MGSGGIEDRLDTSNGIQSVLQHSAKIIAAHMGKFDGFDVLPGKKVVGTLWEFSPTEGPRQAGECVHHSPSELGEQLRELLNGSVVGSQGSVICKSGDNEAEAKSPVPPVPSPKMSLDR